MHQNPFIFGKPVEKDNFYNRKEELEAAAGFLKRLQSFSVVGERRIGKTSFLEYVLSEDVLQSYGIDPEIHVSAYLSLSGLYGISKESLVSSIVKKIMEQTQVEVDSPNVFDTLKTQIKKLSLNDKNLIIALDEFEVIASILDSDFSHWLRFIFQEQNVVAITSSKTTVRELEISGGIASPLFNIFGNIFLRLFLRKETEDMIKKMFHKGGIELEEEEVTFLANLSGGNPYFIQLIGYYYYEKKTKNIKIIPEKFKKSMTPHTNDQFESYWKHLTKEEKKFLVQVESFQDDRVSAILERKGILSWKEGKWEIFSPLFKEFVNSKAKIDKELVFD
jgi:hypothetical protein